jgi:hypothetical protein
MIIALTGGKQWKYQANIVLTVSSEMRTDSLFEVTEIAICESCRYLRKLLTFTFSDIRFEILVYFHIVPAFDGFVGHVITIILEVLSIVEDVSPSSFILPNNP